MDNEIELISDGDGIAVIGPPTDVERFLDSEGLSSKDLGLPRLGAAFSAGAATAQAGAEISANSGRWLKLTKESARAVKEFGLTPTDTPGVSHAMVGKPGDIKQWIQVVTKPGSMLTSPAMLAGAAGIMAQIAMQQSMAEITDYLARIDEKLDDVLRAQTNQVLARVDGVDLAIREAMSVRDTVGRVSEVSWSKVQNSSAKILETQSYALRHLGDLADKIEQKTKVGDLAKTAKEAEAEVEMWLKVLARCFQLQDAIAVLELDRVLDASPDELDRHRLGLKAARRDRLELISQSTELLLARMIAAAGTANSKVLLHPARSPAVVGSSNHIATDIDDFQDALGIEPDRKSSDATRWVDAAAERWDKVRETGAESIDAVRHFGHETRGQARSVRDKLSDRISQRNFRRRERDEERDE
jgi:hypothetical protein